MSKLTRRQVLRNGSLAGIALWTTCKVSGEEPAKSPSEKLNLVGIGVGGRGGADVMGCAHENFIALCDVDDSRASGTFGKFPLAKKYKDFRKMLSELEKQIDAVVIGTPDHTHAAPGVMAMKMGKHCYCEKPLTHSVFEARAMTDAAVENKLVTQMGTQIHAGDNYRRAVELVQSGAIGQVAEVHVWLGANFKGPAVPDPAATTQPDAPTDEPAVPEGLDWDLWLGPAPYRPYHSAYCPFAWRSWWTFGNGQLGDFFCHYCDLAFWALDLKYPLTVESTGPVHPESASRWTISRHEYPARGEKPPVKLNWYNGGPYPALVKEKNVPQWGSAVLFVGEKGMLIADYGRHQLLPEEKFADFHRPEPFIPNSIGHHREWTEACKTGGPTTCDFSYSGPLTEAALLSNVALRVGKKLTWDAENLKATNCPEADAYLKRAYREGWTL